MNRSAGILLSVTSLPSRYGLGCLDSVAFRFVDCLAEAGQTYWQILPLGPTGFGESGTPPINPSLPLLETRISSVWKSWWRKGC